MEKRKFPRQDVRGTPLKAVLILSGGSLLNEECVSQVEIDAHAIDLSRGGMRVGLDFDAMWTTISPMHSVDLFLERDGRVISLKAKVVHVEESEHELGLEFLHPLESMSGYLMPHELQE